MRTLFALVVVTVVLGATALGACKKKEAATDKPAEPVAPAPVEPAPAPTPEPAPAPAPAGNTILDVAKSAGTFSTLLKAIETAGLVETFQGPGPYTLFAPTDEAFAKIPKADLEALLADKAKLADVLSYHVLPGKTAGKDVAALTKTTTVSGKDISIDNTSGVKYGAATVTKTDIEASNGVIHVIDAVVFPD
jgi:uncharacterized surface protein with fasciclin (FAS1) repeats